MSLIPTKIDQKKGAIKLTVALAFLPMMGRLWWMERQRLDKNHAPLVIYWLGTFWSLYYGKDDREAVSLTGAKGMVELPLCVCDVCINAYPLVFAFYLEVLVSINKYICMKTTASSILSKFTNRDPSAWFPLHKLKRLELDDYDMYNSNWVCLTGISHSVEFTCHHP